MASPTHFDLAYPSGEAVMGSRLGDSETKDGPPGPRTLAVDEQKRKSGGVLWGE